MTTVKLISGTGMPSQTPGNYAAALLIFSKSTRLSMSATGFDEILRKCNEDGAWMLTELSYMANTIPSSWEFIDFKFLISDVSRACAQQITRTRTASFAMQSQRVTNMSNAGWHNPVKEKARGAQSENDKVEKAAQWYDMQMKSQIANYNTATEFFDISMEDARGLLPINIHCNIFANYNLRTFSDMVQKRSSDERVQAEYVEIVKQMKEQVLLLYPWASVFFVPKENKAVMLIEQVLKGDDSVSPSNKILLAKARDLFAGA